MAEECKVEAFDVEDDDSDNEDICLGAAGSKRPPQLQHMDYSDSDDDNDESTSRYDKQ